MFRVCIVILCIILILYIHPPVTEPMSMKSSHFNRNLNDHGYYIDTDARSIYDKHDTLIKHYPTLSFNSNESSRIAINKPLTNTILLDHNIPTPTHDIITIQNKNTFKHAKSYFPCVLKPVDGQQGKDVYTHIDTQRQFDLILNQMFKTHDAIMLENLVEGNNYRIFIFNDTILDVIERETPYVIGNGTSTLQELIRHKNNELVSNKRYPVKTMDLSCLQRQGYTLSSIVSLNEKVFITNTINYHNGANPKRIPLHTVDRDNKDMFLKAHRLLGLECSGIDYMSPDITLPYYKNKGHIIEINSNPDTEIHMKAENRPNVFFQTLIQTF